MPIFPFLPTETGSFFVFSALFTPSSQSRIRVPVVLTHFLLYLNLRKGGDIVPETQHIGRKIRNRREKLGWSLEYTAEKCDLCSRALEDIELGKTTDPHLSTVVKIANVLSLDLGELNSCYPLFTR